MWTPYFTMPCYYLASGEQSAMACNEGKNFNKYFHQFSYYILDQLLFNFYIKFFSTIIYDKFSPHFGQFDCSHFDPKEFQPNPFLPFFLLLLDINAVRPLGLVCIILLGIPSTGQIRGVFCCNCNPGTILPHLYVKNIVLNQKLTKLQHFSVKPRAVGATEVYLAEILYWNTILILYLISFLGILSVCPDILHDEW